MNYYQFHVGDYASHTRNLGLLEDLAYRRMLDAYYVNERPFVGGVQDVAREIGMREHIEDVEYVLNRFFMHEGDVWTNKRADAEIEKFKGKSAKAAKAGRASAERRLNERSTSVEKTATDVDESSTDVLPTKNQEPRTNTPTDVGVARKRAAARPDDVAEPVWQDFQRLRAQKRAPLTDTALAGLRREADKAGIGLGDALAYCCEQGWQGFNAGWYADRTGKQPRASPSFRERDEAAASERYRRLTGKDTPVVIDMPTMKAIAS